MELYKKRDSRFYWYDFKWRGKRYRSSTKETNKKRAGRIAALRLSQAIGGIGALDRKAPSLQGFSIRFLSWVESAILAGKSRAYYGNGWRLLSTTKIVGMRLDHISKDDVEGLSLSGSASNANCVRRTLRRMLRKAEEWNLIARVPKFKLLTEHGRRLRLDDDVTSKAWESFVQRICQDLREPPQSHFDLRQISAGSDLYSFGSILAPIKRTKSGRKWTLCPAESTDSFG